MCKSIRLAVVAVAAMLGHSVLADIKLPAIISDNMCLQAGKTLPIWGTADAGEQVTVNLNGVTAGATAGADGKWMVKLPAQQVGGPFAMSVTGKNVVNVKNIVIGQVWVASGQSNMEFTVAGAHNQATEAPQANYPKIRIFNLQKKTSFKPMSDCVGKWEECSPTTVNGTSAVGYFFVRDLHKELNQPMGLIHTSWGGTPAEAWTTIGQMETVPELKPLADKYHATADHLAEIKEKYEKVQMPAYEKAMKDWTEKYKSDFDAETKAFNEEVKAAKAAGKQAPRQATHKHQPPRKPNLPGNDPNVPSVLYNGMIAPVVPFGIQGAIWYQGESNAGNPWLYRTLFPAMITDWRKQWTAANPDEKDFPFYFVQLANFMAQQPDPVQDDFGWPGLREAQHRTLSLPNTGEAVIIDVGQSNDIHPRDKMDVGHRLALYALKVTYNKDIVYCGPTYKSIKVEGNKAILSFDNIGGGLAILAHPSTQPGVPEAAPDKELRSFSIAGEDKVFHWATAKIEGNTVIVHSEKVAKPVAVRYGWANNPDCNLYNKEGLPASPFRTDDWTSKK